MEDVNTLEEAQSSRTSLDFSWLTPSSLPQYLSHLLKDYWAGRDIELTQAGPKMEAVSPGITWRIHRRTPGKDKMDSQKPSYRGSIARPDSGEVCELYAQYQTVVYEFVVHHPDGFGLNQLAEEFEDFLFSVQGLLQERRVDQFLFLEEVRQDVVSPGARNEAVYSRAVRYLCYLQKKFELNYSQIAQINIKTSSVVEKTEDMAVLRDGTKVYDALDLPLSSLAITRVSDVTLSELNGHLLLADSSGGISALELVAGEHLFIKDIDFTLEKLYHPELGQTRHTIIWLSKEGSRQPYPGTTYYVSFRQATLVHETSTHLGESNG